MEDHILNLYELMEIKGKGAYGIVWRAIDKKTMQVVALKKVINILFKDRFLMHLIIQPMHKEHLERWFSWNKWIMKILSKCSMWLKQKIIRIFTWSLSIWRQICIEYYDKLYHDRLSELKFLKTYIKNILFTRY